MELPEAAAYIGRWRPSSVPPVAAAFARQVVTAAGPPGRDRAKNLLWAAGVLAGWAIPLGLDPAPEVLLHPSVIERFTAHAPGLSGPARRTLRTNLRFLGRAVVPALHPQDAPLPRERAKTPYTAAEISGFLALAAAQPTAARQARAAGLVCLGAGAGLIRADLRQVRGSDITCRSGGVIVTVRGGRRPREVPVLARYHQRLLASAAFAGQNLVTGGTDPGRHNISNPLTRSLAGGAGLPALDTSRLRATWLAEAAALIGLPAFMHAAGITPASGSATSPPPWTPAARNRPWRCSARARGEHPAHRGRGHHRRLRRRAGDRGAAPGRRASPPAEGRHLTDRHAAHPG